MMTPSTMSTPVAPSQPSPDPHADFGRLLGHPRLREYLRLSLTAYSLQEADRLEIASQVMDALWRRRTDADPPNNLPRLIALARKVLDGKLTDFFRHREVEREHLVDAPMPAREDGRKGAPAGKDQPNFVDELVPARSFDPESECEVAEKMALVQDKLLDGTLTHDDLEVMQADQAGEATLAELARERNVEPAALRKRLQRIRDALKKEWTIRSTPMLVLTILMLLLLVTLAIAMAGRSDPPPPPQRKDRTEERSPLRGLAPEEVPTPPLTGGKPH